MYKVSLKSFNIVKSNELQTIENTQIYSFQSIIKINLLQYDILIFFNDIYQILDLMIFKKYIIYIIRYIYIIN